MLFSNVIPMVVEQSGRGERAYDIFSLLLKERIVMLGTEVSQQSANLIVAQMLFLDSQDHERPIQLYINSPGGEVYAGLAMYDAMQQVHAPVSTVAVGMTASFGTVLLVGGRAGMRYALPHATIHMHQPHGGAQGQVTDMQIRINEFQRLKNDVIDIFVKHTGQDRERIELDMDRDIYLNPQQAVEYGLIDRVLVNADVVKANGHKAETLPVR
jgi:ATP-dependent Clp protease, protease subunit